MRNIFIRNKVPIALGLLALLSLGFIPTSKILAKVGVGMGAGEIRLTENAKPGGIYKLPSLRVFNTGDETSTYSMGVSYHVEHKELRPTKEWFTFDPEVFTLTAGQSQEVLIRMSVPVKAEPGDYFAFIESGPIASDKPGTTVGISVATKLFLTVVPSNIFKAITYRVSTFFSTNSPWSWIILVIILVAVAVFFFRKYFSFSFAVRKK
jgi:hypothetical protein